MWLFGGGGGEGEYNEEFSEWDYCNNTSASTAFQVIWTGFFLSSNVICASSCYRIDEEINIELKSTF